MIRLSAHRNLDLFLKRICYHRSDGVCGDDLLGPRVGGTHAFDGKSQFVLCRLYGLILGLQDFSEIYGNLSTTHMGRGDQRCRLPGSSWQYGSEPYSAAISGPYRVLL